MIAADITEITITEKKTNRGLVMLKSTVIALFIVLSVSLIGLAFFKVKHQQITKHLSPRCEEKFAINLNQKIDEISFDGSKILITTQVDSKNKQELVIIDSYCGNELSRFVVNVSN